ncbi:hypothetical protein B5F53_16025 [Blautia sp. An249]|uniref:VirD4-like conjugal transfer protein, CD1115 family n=1 Tax=Blautia sp. An249 TaxID=1965603 RepID=UPI000B393A84|nr:type IV secretory system conjugative DNA transfer family protein [Blautia sp. An249]OUO76756.1 hypothetical protein B5F53_16025 [Blautia sp. An249]
MLNNGLKYSDSRMAYEHEFIDNLASFDLKASHGSYVGGPVLFRKDNLCFTDGSDVHDLVIGDTGSMKTLKFVLPLIYSCAMASESMVIVDPKGELVRKAGAFLDNKGYKKVILNWRRPQESPDNWNPFERVQKAYNRGEEDESENYLNDLLQSLFFGRTVKGKDSYWNEVAGQVARGICKLILKINEPLSMKSILEWRHAKMKDGTLKKYFMTLPTNSDIYQNLAGFMNLTAEGTKTCIESTFDQLTGLFASSKALTEMMSNTTFSMEKIGKEKTAIFLVVPDEKTTYHFLATLFISQCYESLLDKADQYGGSLPVRVNFILEEFCNMPKLEDIVAMLTAARSRNIRFHIVLQSYSQMIDKYGEPVSKTVMDNCGNLIYLHTREISFLEYISKLAGKNEFDRPLLSVSRLQHLKKSETVIFHDRCYPMVVENLPLIFEYPMTHNFI